MRENTPHLWTSAGDASGLFAKNTLASRRPSCSCRIATFSADASSAERLEKARRDLAASSRATPRAASPEATIPPARHSTPAAAQTARVDAIEPSDARSLFVR